MPKSRRSILTLGAKRKIQDYYQRNSNLSHSDIKEWVKAELNIDIGRSTVGNIIRMKLDTDGDPASKKKRAVKFPEIEKELAKFYFTDPDNMTDTLLIDKAKTLRSELHLTEKDIKFSNGWLEKFKTRNGLQRKKSTKDGYVYVRLSKYFEKTDGEPFHVSEEFIEEFLQYLTNLRHEFHQYPEPAYEEFRTQRRIIQELHEVAKIPMEHITKCASTGIIADIYGKKGDTGAAVHPKAMQCVAIRADMDCLRITEENYGLTFQSKNPKCAHMSGHDGHMACLLGAAFLLQKAVDKLPNDSKVRLIFQPAEENAGGAKRMIQEGCLDGVDEIYSMQNTSFPFGTVRICKGPIMSHETEFTVKLFGKGGHGSAPHMTSDPIVAASHLILSLQSIVSRDLNPLDTAVLSVTRVQAGEASNAIPTSATIIGTIRNVNEETDTFIKQRIRQMADSISMAFSVTNLVNFSDGYPPVINSPGQADFAKTVLEKVVGEEYVTDKDLPLMASQGFSYYLKKTPGCFFLVGGKEDKDYLKESLHSAHYDFNDNILPLMSRVWVEIVQGCFNTELYSHEELSSIYSVKRVIDC